MAKGLVGDERERDVGMYATYRQRMKRVREKQVRKRERERGAGERRSVGGQGVSGEDIISPMQIAFGLRPAEYTLALAARVRLRCIFRGR